MRKYNKNHFNNFKKGNKKFRDTISPNYTKKLDVFGIIGKIIGFFIHALLNPLVHILSYKVTGKIYDKKKDTPYFGSIIYTIVNFAVCLCLFGIISYGVYLYCKIA